jgi:hypothetical protein
MLVLTRSCTQPRFASAARRRRLQKDSEQPM